MRVSLPPCRSFVGGAGGHPLVTSSRAARLDAFRCPSAGLMLRGLAVMTRRAQRTETGPHVRITHTPSNQRTSGLGSTAVCGHNRALTSHQGPTRALVSTGLRGHQFADGLRRLGPARGRLGEPDRAARYRGCVVAGLGFLVRSVGRSGFGSGVQLSAHVEVHTGRVQLPPPATGGASYIEPDPGFNENGSPARGVCGCSLVREHPSRGSHDALCVALSAGLQIGYARVQRVRAVSPGLTRVLGLLPLLLLLVLVELGEGGA